MHVLTVLDHPNPGSLSHAVADRFETGARIAGHTTERADLHAEGFNPLWSMADIEADAGTPAPADVLAEQTRIDRCDALCLIFPLFWWGMPSMMKGWIDRVWSWGWAYDQLDDPEKSLQRDRTGLLLIPAGASSDNMAQEGADAAIDSLWMNSTFGYFGLKDRRMVFLHGSTGSEARRKALLDRAEREGRAIGTSPTARPVPPA